MIFFFLLFLSLESIILIEQIVIYRTGMKKGISYTPVVIPLFRNKIR